jgi:LmbE family N-acetylglucosaminyl deacetylase
MPLAHGGASIQVRPMTDTDLTRRTFIRRTASTVAPAVVAGALPLSSALGAPDAARLSIICVGAHPDDPESGCAGTLARYAALGHTVKIVYLTRGERGVTGKSLDDAARIRTAESNDACRIIGAAPLFFGQIDGATEVTHAHVSAMMKLLVAAKPDVIFTHWPVDTHMDHQVASLLAIRAWMSLGSADLFFYEVNAGSQTEGFLPNTYVDISAVVEQKKRALFAHVSQDGQGIWRQYHEVMAAWRGREIGVAAAEAFVHHSRGGRGQALPGV